MAWKPDYIDGAELGDYLGVDASFDDTLLQVWATAASRAVDKRCNRQFGKTDTPVARTYRRAPVWQPRLGLWTVEIDDIQTTTGLTVNGVAYATSGAVLLPDDAPAEGKPWERIGFEDVTPEWPPMVLVGTFGWSAVPTQVVGASYLQGARWNARRNSPLGVAGSPDQGSEIRLLAKLDPDVAVTLTGLARFRRVG